MKGDGHFKYSQCPQSADFPFGQLVNSILKAAILLSHGVFSGMRFGKDTRSFLTLCLWLLYVLRQGLKFLKAAHVSEDDVEVAPPAFSVHHFSLCGAGDGAQGFLHARQALFLLCHISSPIYIFFKTVGIETLYFK